MYSTNRKMRLMGLAASSAMAGALLSGCAAFGTPTANASATSSEAALAKGDASRAVTLAEDAVQADPRNAAYRATAGHAYLEAGRFNSAATAYNEAIELGDNSARTALSLALSYIGGARFGEAITVLDQSQGKITTADLGLAYALAGQPERAIHVLGNEIRAGGNTAKVRQNLAYSYALAGRWREARLMAEQDVPAGEVDSRMEEWAQLSHPLVFQTRVAALLDVPAGQADGGMPTYLALANYPETPLLAAEESRPAVTDTPVVRVALPTTASAAPAPAPATSAPAASAPAPAALAVAEEPVERAPKPVIVASLPADELARLDAQQSASTPVVQDAPARTSTTTSAAPTRTARAETPAPAPSRPAPSRAATEVAVTDPTHLVQLGSFTSEAGAKRAWGIYVGRYPELANHDMVITEAVVRGKRYWRVSAGGYNASTATSMCNRVKSSGSEGCFAWAETRPLPGAVDRGNVRLASR